MTRTVLVHLNVELPADVAATDDDVADAILAAIEVGRDNPDSPILAAMTVTAPLAESV